MCADAHPFSYMLDLKKESLRFDPDGNYVRRWLPVLARMPIKYIHRYVCAQLAACTATHG